MRVLGTCLSGHYRELMGGTLMKFWKRLLAAPTAILIIGATLAGVEGSASGAGTSGTINIGFICSCTGPEASSVAITKPAYQAWESWVNAHGGIEGSKVNVIYEDDLSNPATSLSEVSTLVVRDHVIAIVDSGSQDTAWATYVQSHGIPVVGGLTTTDAFVTNPDFFASGQTLDTYNTNFVLAAKKVGAKSMAVFYCAEAAVCQQGVPPLKATAQKLNTPLVYTSAISGSAPNFTAQCLAAKDDGAQALVIADATAVVESVMASCSQQGYTPWAINLGSGVGLSFTTSPGLSNRLVGSEPDLPFYVKTTPAAKTYFAALKKYQPGILSSPNYGEGVTQLWVSGLLLQAAAAKSGVSRGAQLTSAKLKHGLYALKGDTLGGMAPPLTFHKGVGNPVDCWFWIRTQNGKFTTPYGLKPDCVPPVAVS
jgi:branched-chain amino acid transport system substrate-binding protein